MRPIFSPLAVFTLTFAVLATTGCQREVSSPRVETTVGASGTPIATETRPTAPSATRATTALPPANKASPTPEVAPTASPGESGAIPTAVLPVPTEEGLPTPEPRPTTAPVDGIVTIDVGQFTDYETEAAVVVVARDKREWEALWANHRRDDPTKAPDVDFSQRQVIAVFLGASGGGDTVEITSVLALQGALAVRAAYRTPAEGCGVPAVVSYPFHIVSVPRMPGGARLELITEVVPCD